MMKLQNKMNITLSIALPTYNRGDYLDFYFQTHVPRFMPFNIAVYVSDNCSSDNSLAIIEKWQKIYPHIYYRRLDENVHVDENVESALNFAKSDYVWLMGDSYELPESSIRNMLDILENREEDYDLVLANLVNRIKDIPEKIYTKADAAFEDLAWMATCISCNVFHKSMIENGDYGKYKRSEFCHVGFIFDYFSNRKFSLYWAPTVPVVTLKTPVVKGGWGQYYLSNMFDKWPALIESLPSYYSKKSKIAVMQNFAIKGKMLNWRLLLKSRAQGFLNKKSRTHYKTMFSIVAPKSFRYYSYVLTFIPPILCNLTLKVVEFVRRKNYQIQRFLYPDKII